MRVSHILLAATAMIAGPAAAQSNIETILPDEGQSAQGDVSLTIYNNNLGLVQDVRRLSFPVGRTRQEFPDVSAQIRAETVNFAARGASIVEQNFDYDLLTPQKLMAKAVGQTVTLVRFNPATGAEEQVRAKILSTNGGVVMQVGNRIEVLRTDGFPTRVIFDSVPPNLRARPTLSVTVESDRAGARDAAISYLTPGLGWQADYVTLYDEGSGLIDVQGWITLTNNTGTSFNDAKVVMVAGSPAIGDDMDRYQNQRRNRPAASPSMRPGTESGTRGRLGDFYLYPLAQRTTVANAQTKQVSFLDVKGAPAQKAYEIRANFRQNDEEARSADSVLKFSTSAQGGLGDQLPRGIVRVYMRDSGGQPQFIGESRVDHTPMGSELAIKTGEAFDVKAEVKTISRERISGEEWDLSRRYRITEGDDVRVITVEKNRIFYRTVMEYRLTNAKPEAAVVDIMQVGLGGYYRDTRVTQETIEGTQLDYDRRLYSVSVPANGERTIRVTYETRY